MKKLGFVIDNRKCIGCHACTTACKSEHEVPLGVNRTWVKYIEEGSFPDTTRSFSVMRCNHCTDAPCVEMCPVTALYIREDGIVDFDNKRCIGCKACTQACPYDALYIDPVSSTAAKCNFCSHRVDVGLEPACVVVCPEHAIVAFDMNDPNSEGSLLLAQNATTVRKPEKKTSPNLFYIDAVPASLEPSLTSRQDYLWSAQATGVGKNKNQQFPASGSNHQEDSSHARRVYDAPDKGILWGWEVVGYLNTKAVAAGLMLVLSFLYFSGFELSFQTILLTACVSLLFMLLTAALLIKDLKQPKRFLYIVFRPQFKSWLARGTYIILSFCAVLAFTILGAWMEWKEYTRIMLIISVPMAVLTTIYTAYLFGQAKGRAFWKNNFSPFFMLSHACIFGVMGMSLILVQPLHELYPTLQFTHIIALLFTIALFLGTQVKESKMASQMILQGRYKFHYWGAAIVLGSIVPALLQFFLPGEIIFALSSMLLVMGIIVAGFLFIKIPQLIPLS